jgi:hypothetical protein
MPCPVCQHNQTNIIDRALLAGADPTTLSRTYGFSPSALSRHQERLTQKMAQAGQRFHDNLRQGLFCKLTQVMEMVLFVVREAKTGGDFKFFLQASREFTRIIGLMHKMAADLHLDPEFIYCLMASPQWDLQEESLLPRPYQAMTENRQSLKVNLFAPCPEPEPEPDHPPGRPLETRNQKLETSDLEPDPSGISHRLPETPSAKPARKKREKSAKSPRKSVVSNSINEEYQSDMLCDKNSQEKRENLWQKFWRKWEKSGKLPGKNSQTCTINELSQ